MAKTASEVVKASETRRGIRSTSVKLDPDEMALWDRMAEKHGGRKASLVAALERLDGRKDITRADVLAWIERNT